MIDYIKTIRSVPSSNMNFNGIDLGGRDWGNDNGQTSIVESMKKLLTLLCLVFLLAGCVSVRNYGRIEQNDRTIVVPAGGFSILVDVKDVLRELGWQMYVATPGQIPQARYTLTFTSNKMPITTSYATTFLPNGHVATTTAIAGDDEDVSISVVDNRTNTEVFIISSTELSTEFAILLAFRKAMLGNAEQ